MSLRRTLRLLLVPIAALLLVVIAAGFWVARGGRPLREGERRVGDLVAPVEIRFDARGVPAVRAESGRDAAFALGWLHANDRLFQMELTRRAAEGRLAELFGERALGHDRRLVRLGFRGALSKLGVSMAPETRAEIEAYAAGVNAWLAERGGDLPPEFRLLRHRPAPWRVDDTLSVLFVMARQLSPVVEPNEEELFRLLAAFGPERAKELAGDPSAVVFDEIAELAESFANGKQTLGAKPEGANLGSNNWAVAPARSASGGALLAGDPHLDLGLPNVWYQARLQAPDYDASGMTLPGAPGVVLGRGRDLAWACTNLYIDDVDLFVERVDPSGTKVLRGASWVPIAVARETIGAGEYREELEVLSTDRGAFLRADPERGLPARSVAWTGWMPGDQITAFLALARARSAADLGERVAGYGFPAQNLVVASSSGEIGWTPLGRGPDRFGWDGHFPAPAWRTDVGWRGLLPAEGNPLLLNPESGAIATANSLLPIERPAWFGEEFDTPHRVERIRQELARRTDWTPEAFVALQLDAVSLWARELIAALGGASGVGYAGDAAKAAAALGGWDGAMDRHGPAALFALFERELQRRTFEDEAKSAGIARFGNRERLSALLAGRLSETFWDDVATPTFESRHEIVDAALAAAWRNGVERWGERVEAWPYGSIHRLRLDHPLGGLPLVGRLFNRGPYELPGSSTTILAFGGPWREGAIDVAYGPSMRFVTDASDPERTLTALPGGQSGHPFDAHYDDRIDTYLRGETDPAPWSEAALAKTTLTTLRLLPAAGGDR